MPGTRAFEQSTTANLPPAASHHEQLQDIVGNRLGGQSRESEADLPPKLSDKKSSSSSRQ
jgi:hypothetical protein